MASTCKHPPGTHQCIANVKIDGKYPSELTAEYPLPLAQGLATIFAPFLTQKGWSNASITDFSDLLPETYAPQRMRLCDGAGMNSTADHTFPKSSKLHELAELYWKEIEAQQAADSATLHLQSAQPSHPFGEELQESLARIAASHLLPSTPIDEALHISPGQPHRLQLLHAIASQSSDPDLQLIPLLEEGVPTGVFSTLPSSMQWQQRQDNLSDNSMDDIQLQQCTGNWCQAERDPTLLKTLLDKEISSGQVLAFEGDRKTAAKHWPQGVAIGKPNIVIAGGRDPRSVLDNTVCNANTLCRVPEHVALPSAHEVMRSFQHGDAW